MTASRAARIQGILRDLGWTERRRGDDDADLRWAATIEDPVQMLRGWRGLSHLLPLAELGWVALFDGEGQYFEDGQHARVVDYLLRGAGVELSVSDHWADTTHHLTIGDGTRAASFVQTHGHVSDYADMALLLAATLEGFRLVDAPFTAHAIDTGDQGVCLVTLPLDVDARMHEAGLLTRVVEHALPIAKRR